jgi:hypothetical protein
MTVNMIIRRKGDYKDPRLEELRKEGVPLLMKHGARSHGFGYYQSGAHAGQIFIVLSYPDLDAHERAMKGMAQDSDWTRISAAVDEIAPLQESYLTVVTEER